MVFFFFVGTSRKSNGHFDVTLPLRQAWLAPNKWFWNPQATPAGRAVFVFFFVFGPFGAAFVTINILGDRARGEPSGTRTVNDVFAQKVEKRSIKTSGKRMFTNRSTATGRKRSGKSRRVERSVHGSVWRNTIWHGRACAKLVFLWVFLKKFYSMFSYYSETRSASAIEEKKNKRSANTVGN